ncbi:MAG: 4-hydroxy-tetrahydrodipicolinate synthase [Clostridia bacterium]|nr:4-hydroxy-tetrahydrodipicolinate synthase [Clostridia bacterium]
MKNPFFGTIVPLITPFDGGEVDYPALERLIAYCKEGGADGFVCLGTTAEAPTLNEREKREILAFTLKRAEGLPVIAGAGSNCTREAIRLTALFEKDGANGVLSVCPYYNKPPESGIIAHFEHIAKSTRLPVILYDVPQRTGKEITANAANILKRIPNVVAIKEAGDTAHLLAMRSVCDGDLALLGGNDALISQTMKLGGAGMISAAANVMPKTVSGAVRLYGSSVRLADGVIEGAAEAIAALQIEVNPVPLKYALFKKGLIKNELRLPMCPLSRKKEALIDRLINKFI